MLLGFSSCNKDPDSLMQLMYASPYVRYEIKGTVTDTKGKPIKDAKVIVRNLYMLDAVGYYQIRVANDTVSVDDNGKYLCKFTWDTRPESLPFRVVAKSPYHKADSTEINIVHNSVKDPEDGWMQGKGEATVDFTLK